MAFLWVDFRHSASGNYVGATRALNILEWIVVRVTGKETTGVIVLLIDFINEKQF